MEGIKKENKEAGDKSFDHNNPNRYMACGIDMGHYIAGCNEMIKFVKAMKDTRDFARSREIEQLYNVFTKRELSYMLESTQQKLIQIQQKALQQEQKEIDKLYA